MVVSLGGFIFSARCHFKSNLQRHLAEKMEDFGCRKALWDHKLYFQANLFNFISWSDFSNMYFLCNSLLTHTGYPMLRKFLNREIKLLIKLRIGMYSLAEDVIHLDLDIFPPLPLLRTHRQARILLLNNFSIKYILSNYH